MSDKKPARKTTTEGRNIDLAEQRLDIKYPLPIRERLKKENGFSWGYFEKFYPVFDEEDKFHTFDDVVRENENPQAGWKQYLPEGCVAIADDGGGHCLVLKTSKDGRTYYWNNDSGELSVFASNDEELTTKFDEQNKDLEKIN